VVLDRQLHEVYFPNLRRLTPRRSTGSLHFPPPLMKESLE
jgi:hypothetical protein